MPPLQDALAVTVHYLALQPRHPSRVYAALKTQQCLRNTARGSAPRADGRCVCFLCIKVAVSSCHSLSDAAINQASSPSQDAKKA